MKENSSSDLQQPEMSTEYIEYLFSGKKKKKPVPKKLLFSLGGAVLAVVLVCLLLDPLANCFHDSWQILCGETYEEYAARDTLHLLMQELRQMEGKEPELKMEQEAWREGRNLLSHYGKRIYTYGVQGVNQTLQLDGRFYTRYTSEQNADAPWQWDQSVTIVQRKIKTWEDYSYAVSEVHIDFSGIQVTCTKALDPSRENVRTWLVFHFDFLGNLTFVSYNNETLLISGKRRTEIQNYTIYDTGAEEIHEVLDECRREVENIAQ